MLRRNRTLSFIIIGVALLITLGALAAERLNIYTLPSRAVAKVPITVAVPPALQTWADSAARDFNSSNPDAQIRLITVDGFAAVEEFADTAPVERPHAWIPEASFLQAVAADRGLAYTPNHPSLISAELMWGSFADREQALGTIDWHTVHNAATASGWDALNGDAAWGYFKLMIASPTRSPEGVAALISAAAAYHDTTLVTRAHVTDPAFLNWLGTTLASVPNFSTLGPNPAEALATRGPSVGDVGLLPANDWHMVLDELGKRGPFSAVPTQKTVVLDYPYWQRADVTDAERAMVDRFGNYLADEASKLTADGFSVQPTDGVPVIEADNDAVLALMRWAVREGIGQ